MILTCNTCPRQICFHGKNRDAWVALFGWLFRNNRYFCSACAEGEE